MNGIYPLCGRRERFLSAGLRNMYTCLELMMVKGHDLLYVLHVLLLIIVNAERNAMPQCSDV